MNWKQQIAITIALGLVLSLPMFAEKPTGEGKDSPGTKETPEVFEQLPQGLETFGTPVANPKHIVVLFPQAMALVPLFRLQTQVVGLPLGKVNVSMHEGGFFQQNFPKMLDFSDVGYPGKANIEAILALKPDLIIEPSFHVATSKFLEKLKQPRFRMLGTFSNMDDWLTAVEKFGEVIGHPETGKAYGDYCRAKVKLVNERIQNAASGKKPRAIHLIKMGNKYICFGRRVSFANHLLSLCGFEVFGANSTLQSDGVFSIEEALAFDPDYLFLEEVSHSSAKQAMNLEEPFWKQFRAVKEGRVLHVPIDDHSCFLTGWYFNLAAPLGLLWTAKTVRPELFADVDLEKEANDFYQKFFAVSRPAILAGNEKIQKKK